MPERTNALWFFVALFGGGAGVWWAKSVFPDVPWFAATVAAAVVLGLMIYYMLNDEDAPEEEGDNVYYLGLLFTLISLMFTLVELFGGGTDTEPNAEKIRTLLENFGIALTSTVVGIAGRVAVQNWQWPGSARKPEFAVDTAIPVPPPADASSQHLEQFNRYLLGRIAHDLTLGANALARFHRIVRSHASDTEEHLRNHSETLKRESAAFKDTVQRNAETFARELRDKAENMLDVAGGSLDAAAKQIEALPERLRSTHDDYLTELRTASGHSLDTLRQNFGAAAQQSLSLAQNASTIHERIGKAFDSLESGLGHASEASAAFGSSARQAAKSTTALEVEVNKLRAVLVTVHAGAEAMKGMLDAMGELDARIRTSRDMEQTATAVREIGETLQTITTQAAAATERVAEATELFDALRRGVRTTEDETRHAAEALRALAAEAEARTKALRQRQGSGWKFWKRSR